MGERGLEHRGWLQPGLVSTTPNTLQTHQHPLPLHKGQGQRRVNGHRGEVDVRRAGRPEYEAADGDEAPILLPRHDVEEMELEGAGEVEIAKGVKVEEARQEGVLKLRQARRGARG